MADDKPFSRADLVAISGAPDDAVAFWLRNGLLGDSDRAARKHRRFSVREVKMAALLKEFRSAGLNIAVMRAITVVLKQSFEQNDRLWKLHPAPNAQGLVDILHWSIEGEFAAFKDHMLRWGSSEEQANAIIDFAGCFPKDHEQQKLIPLADAFDTAGDELCLYRSAGDEWDWSLGAQFDRGLPAPFVIAFDFKRILSLDWPAEDRK